jgi:hypothetical protein
MRKGKEMTDRQTDRQIGLGYFPFFIYVDLYINLVNRVKLR